MTNYATRSGSSGFRSTEGTEPATREPERPRQHKLTTMITTTTTRKQTTTTAIESKNKKNKKQERSCQQQQQIFNGNK